MLEPGSCQLQNRKQPSLVCTEISCATALLSPFLQICLPKQALPAHLHLLPNTLPPTHHDHLILHDLSVHVAPQFPHPCPAFLQLLLQVL